MARPPIHLEWLLGHGKTAEEKYEILRLNDCLSAEALTGKGGVIALIGQKMREQALASEGYRNVVLPPGYEPSRFLLESALQKAGYLNERGASFNDKIADTSSVIRMAGGDFKECEKCRHLVRLNYNFCPQCRYDLRYSSRGVPGGCPSCGGAFNNKEGFCPSCGTIRTSNPFALGICPFCNGEFNYKEGYCMNCEARL